MSVAAPGRPTAPRVASAAAPPLVLARRIVAVCIAYVAVLLLLPLIGILDTALEPGLSVGRRRRSARPEVRTPSGSRA